MTRRTSRKKKITRRRLDSGRATAGINTFTWVGLAGILLLTYYVFSPALQNGFVWDDLVYVQTNPLITSIDIPAFFTTYFAGNYHPLTLLVHAIDYQWFGEEPAGYHLINILLHVVNTTLVFFIMVRFTRNSFIALAVTLLFGIHTLHVESVAWISELKDVLYAMFFFAGILTYLKYQDSGKKQWLIITVLFYLLSVLSKGMAVSFPLVLVLLDFVRGNCKDLKVWVEKIPFFVIALIFGIVAIFAQQAESATQENVIPVIHRIVFAGYGYINYLIKLIFPVSLSAYYPYPVAPSEPVPAKYFIFPLLAMGILIYTFFRKKKSLELIFGIGFFTATIIMVLKLLPVGYAVMADRYAYIPSVGIFYLLAAVLYKLYMHPSRIGGKFLSLSIICIGGILLSSFTYLRTKVWKDNLTLWNSVIEHNPKNSNAFLNRGVHYMDNSEYEKAEEDLNQAIFLNSINPNHYYNRGLLYIRTNRPEKALADYNKAIALDSTMAKSYINRGNLLMEMGRFEEALADYNKGLELDPAIPEAFNNRGLLYANNGMYAEAIRDYSKSIELNPRYFNAFVNRGNVYMETNQLASAIQDFSLAISLNSTFPVPHYQRGRAHLQLGERQKACDDFQAAMSLGHTLSESAFTDNCR